MFQIISTNNYILNKTRYNLNKNFISPSTSLKINQGHKFCPMWATEAFKTSMDEVSCRGGFYTQEIISVYGLGVYLKFTITNFGCKDI